MVVDTARAPSQTQLAFSGTFTYPGFFGKPAKCHLTVWRIPGGPPQEVVPGLTYYPEPPKVIFIATEIPHQKGTSITNAVESLVLVAANRFVRSGQAWAWIECYPRRGRQKHLQESFSRVVFDEVLDCEQRVIGFDRPEWTPLRRARVAELLGVTEDELVRTLPYRYEDDTEAAT